jgi:hypothetical protein
LHRGGKEIVNLLTSAECRQIAERKIGQAAGDRRYGKELRATAEAWLVLAQKIAQAEALEARRPTVENDCRVT